MNARSRSILACFTDTVVAPAADDPTVAQTQAVDALERLLPPVTSVLLHALELGPVIRYRRRLRQLAQPERERFVRALYATPARPLVDALASMAQMAYYGGTPQVHGRRPPPGSAG